MKKFLLLLLLFPLLFSCEEEYKGVSTELVGILKERVSALPKKRAKEIISSLKATPEEMREGAAFLYAYMPQHDLDTLSTSLIEENVEYAYKARNRFAWAKDLPIELFYNDVLPYVTMDETRDMWRAQFYDMIEPLVADCKDAGEAVAIINKEIKNLVKVEYNTKRRKANQSPAESMEIGMASCSGLSIILTDALRAVGIPSRIAGTPLWVTKEGNHNWNEVWIDGEWFFTEYYPTKLNDSWFLPRCADFEGQTAPEHQVYAASFKPTGSGHFPLVWDMKDKTVPGYNVTQRYVDIFKAKRASRGVDINKVAVTIKVYKKGGDPSVSADRVKVDVTLYNAKNKEILKDSSRDATADMNDYLVAYLKKNQSYKLVYGGKTHNFDTDNNTSKEIILYY